jgi:hypothetical protein
MGQADPGKCIAQLSLLHFSLGRVAEVEVGDLNCEKGLDWPRVDLWSPLAGNDEGRSYFKVYTPLIILGEGARREANN